MEELARRAGIPHGAHVLDIGCGLGGSALWLAQELGCSVIAITVSAVQKRVAEKRALFAAKRPGTFRDKGRQSP